MNVVVGEEKGEEGRDGNPATYGCGRDEGWSLGCKMTGK
jgi:hypothetical protein